MKGVVFNLLEAFVVETFGEDAYETLLDQTELETDVYVAPATYDDAQLFAMVGTATRLTGLPAPQVLRTFGRFCFPRLAAAYPVFLEGHADARSFLLSVDEVIHIEVAKLMEGAVLPKMTFEETPTELRIVYRSSRNLCHFMEGLIDGVADHFDTPIEHRQATCVHEGDDCCEFALSFLVRA